MALPEFQLLRPRTLPEAITFRAQHGPEAQILAGGTDLIPSLSQQLFTPRYVMDIRRIGELRGISSSGEGTAIGALTTLAEIERSEHIRLAYPVLYEAAHAVGSATLRNMGTIGGNLCLDTRCVWYNQPLAWRKACGFCIKKDGNLCHIAPAGNKCWAAFAGDTAPALLCLDAEVEVMGPDGVRRVPLPEFYKNVGNAGFNIASNEFLTRVLLPASSAGLRGAYRKLARRHSIDYPLAGVAVAMKFSDAHAGAQGNGDGRPHPVAVEYGRIAITAVNSAPLLVKAADLLLAGQELTDTLAEQVAELAAKTAKPLPTTFLTPEYRREMVRVFTKRAVLAMADQ